MATTTEKKIAIRKAPAEKAGIYEEGFIAPGTDDFKYIVKVDKNNIKRWMKMKTEETEKPEVETEKPLEKPKRIYKKKPCEPKPEVETEKPKEEPEPQPETTKPKPCERTYKKKTCEAPKVVEQREQETQTDEEPEPPTTPTKPKKERKIPDTPDKKKH